MDAFEILVVVLSVILALLLVAMTICGFVLAKILKDVRNITSKASLAADNIEHAAMMFKNTSGLASVVKIIGNAVDSFRSNSKKEKN